MTDVCILMLGEENSCLVGTARFGSVTQYKKPGTNENIIVRLRELKQWNLDPLRSI